MGCKIFTGDVGGTTLVWALNWETWAVVLMILDGVIDKLFATVLAWLCAFGTLSHGVLGQESPHHPCSTLVLTVNTLLGTNALVILEGLAGELASAELTLDFALRAVVLQVLGQVATCQLDAAAVRAWDHIKCTGREMALQLLHLAGPAAAFLTVDTADSEGQDLLLQLRVRVDLGIVQGELILWALEHPLTEELLEAGVAESVAAGGDLHRLPHGFAAQRALEAPLGLLQELIVVAGHGDFGPTKADQ